MGGPDSFEALLAEELVKLHRRLLVEHRRYSAALVGRQTNAERRAQGIQVLTDVHPDALVETASPVPEDEEQGALTPPEVVVGKHAVLTLTSPQEDMDGKESAEMNAEDHSRPCTGRSHCAYAEEDSSRDAGSKEKAGVDQIVEQLESVCGTPARRPRLESVCDSVSDPDAAKEANGNCGSDGSPKHSPYASEAKDSEPPGAMPQLVESDVCEKVRNCPVAAAAAVTALAAASKASSSTSMPQETPKRGAGRKISFTTRINSPRRSGQAPQAESDEAQAQPTPKGRWRRQSITAGRDGNGRVDDRKPSLANLTDQLAETLRSDMRRPSITSLRSSGGSMQSPRMSHGFDVLPVWKRSVLMNARSRMTQMASGMGNLVRRNSTIVAMPSSGEKGLEDMDTLPNPEPTFLSYLIMTPSSLPRLCWDFFAMILILYDCLVIPMMVFEEELSFAAAMVWVTRIFWTINVPMSALTGFLRKDGTVEMAPREAFKNYLQSWFPVDMLVISIDWAEVMVQMGSGGWTRFGNVLRLLRIVRVVRILRFIKAPEVMDFFNEYIRSEEVMLMASLAKVILLTLSVAHVIACLWYGVGRISSNDDRRWVKMSNTEDMGFGQQYLVSFHWSLAQFAGELIIEPQNDSERAFTVVVLFLAIIGSSMFVSTVTTSMTRLQILSSKQSSQLATLRRFLLDRNISRPLATRVQQNAQYALMEQKKDIPEASVDLLNMISNPLLVELHFEIYSHVLLEHPFFQCYNHINPGGVQKVCNQCVRLFTMYKGDLLFSDFEVPSSKRMYFIINGGLVYTQPKRIPVHGHRGQWLCEAFLWTQWSHCGTARVNQTSRFLALDAEKFQSIIATFPTPHARHYAELFVEALNEFAIEELTDLETLMEDLDDLIEEAFPVEEEEREMANTNSDGSGGGSQESRSLGGSSESLGVGSQSSMNTPQERRASFSRTSSARRSGDLKPSGSSKNKLNVPGSGTFHRRLSGSIRHERASQVAKRLGRLSRKGSMSDNHRFMHPGSWGISAFMDRHRWCTCFRERSCRDYLQAVREAFGRWRRGGEPARGHVQVQPFNPALPGGH